MLGAWCLRVYEVYFYCGATELRARSAELIPLQAYPVSVRVLFLFENQAAVVILLQCLPICIKPSFWHGS